MSDTPLNVDPSTNQGSARAPKQAKSKRGRRLMMIIIILLLLGLTAISAVLISFIAPSGGVANEEEAKGIEWIRSIYGWGQGPEEQLLSPQEVYVDDNGLIWVTDQRFPDRTLVFNPEGRLIKSVGQGQPQPVITAGPMATGLDDGRVFLGESAMDRVRVFDQNARELGAISIPDPIDLFVAGDKLVVGSINGFAILNAEDGNLIKLVGERGKEDNQFDSVNGVTVGDDGTIYVVDSFNNRLSAYTPEGDRKWIVKMGSSGNQVDLTGGGAMAASRETTAEAKMQLPADITIDGRGRLVVVDSMDFSIAVFDPANGDLIAKYGAYGAKDGQFVYPSSIAYDPARDWFAVADAGNARVQLIRIPDSAAQNQAVAAARRALAGPLRACLIPLLLLLILIIVLVWRSRRNKKAQRAAQGPTVAGRDASTDAAQGVDSAPMDES